MGGQISRGQVIKLLEKILKCPYDDVPMRVEQLIMALHVPPVVIGVAYHPFIAVTPPNLTVSSLPEVSGAYTRAAEQLRIAADIVGERATELLREEIELRDGEHGTRKPIDEVGDQT